MKSMVMAVLGSILLCTSASAKTETVTKVNSGPLHSIRVTDAAGLLTNGTLDVISFVAREGKIKAICKLKGTIGCVDIEDDCEVPVDLSDCDGGPIRSVIAAPFMNQLRSTMAAKLFHCDCLDVQLENCTIRRVTGLALDLIPEKVQCTTSDYSEDLLCEVSTGIRSVDCTTEKAADYMNRLL